MIPEIVNSNIKHIKITDQLLHDCLEEVQDNLMTFEEALCFKGVPTDQIDFILRSNKYSQIAQHAKLLLKASIKTKIKNVKDITQFMGDEDNEQLKEVEIKFGD